MLNFDSFSNATAAKTIFSRNDAKHIQHNELITTIGCVAMTYVSKMIQCISPCRDWPIGKIWAHGATEETDVRQTEQIELTCVCHRRMIIGRPRRTEQTRQDKTRNADRQAKITLSYKQSAMCVCVCQKIRQAHAVSYNWHGEWTEREVTCEMFDQRLIQGYTIACKHCIRQRRCHNKIIRFETLLIPAWRRWTEREVTCEVIDRKAD